MIHDQLCYCLKTISYIIQFANNRNIPAHQNIQCSVSCNFWISDLTTSYQMSKNGPYSSKHIHLHEKFHKEKYLSLEKVIVTGR